MTIQNNQHNNNGFEKSICEVLDKSNKKVIYKRIDELENTYKNCRKYMFRNILHLRNMIIKQKKNLKNAECEDSIHCYYSMMTVYQSEIIKSIEDYRNCFGNNITKSNKNTKIKTN